MDAVDQNELVLVVDETVYSHGALLRTCYSFTDRLYVFITCEDAQHLAVNLKAKQPAE